MKVLLAVLVLCGFFAIVCFAEENPLAAAGQSLESGDFARAKELALAANEAGASAEAFFILGKAEFGLGDFDLSIDAYSEAVKLDPAHAESYAQRGMARTNKGMGMNMFAAGPLYMKALDDYKKAVEVDPDNLTGLIGLARYYSNAPAIGGGSMVKAKEHAAEVARVNPYLGHIEIGLIAQKENRLEDAQKELAAALAMNSSDVWLNFELAKLYQQAGEMPKAKAAFEATLKHDPNHEGAKAALASF